MMTTTCFVRTTRRLTGILVSVLIWAFAATAGAQQTDTENGSEPLWIEGTHSSPGVQGPESPYPELVESVGPAVVSIMVSYDTNAPPPRQSHPFGIPMPERLAEGSGFIINTDGYVVTNYHVIERASALRVRMVDDREFEAEVVGGDPRTDLALLRIESDEPLPAVPLGDSSRLSPGDYVVAIGNPLGLSHTVTAGIISALDRRDLPIQGEAHQGNFIQIDAPINPGNSGGPLLDMNGAVIGINTAVNRQGQGISFAIPVDLLKRLLPQLRDRGWVDRSWLGVRIQPLDPLLARSFGLENTDGALITEVVDDSPADSAGLTQQDVIVAVDGEPLVDSDALPLQISTTPGGTSITLQIVRDGSRRDVEVELQSLPDQSRPELPSTTESAHGTASAETGLEVEAVSDSDAGGSEAGDRGVVVTSLDENSPARHAGVRSRDVILEVGSTPVDTAEEFHSAIEDYDDGDVIRLTLLRNGRTVYKALTR